jgi:hypothetical protein
MLIVFNYIPYGLPKVLPFHLYMWAKGEALRHIIAFILGTKIHSFHYFKNNKSVSEMVEHDWLSQAQILKTPK